ncbi:hypothetical protein, partial [Rathayibacter toxicus]
MVKKRQHQKLTRASIWSGIKKSLREKFDGADLFVAIFYGVLLLAAILIPGLLGVLGDLYEVFSIVSTVVIFIFLLV